LKKELSLQSIMDNPEEFNQNFKTIIYYKFDSIDYQKFCGAEANNAQLLAMGVLKHSVKSNFASNDHLSKKIMYQDLIEKLMQVKQMEDYPKVRAIVIARNELSNKKASKSNWDDDKKLIHEIGFNEQQTNEIYELVVKNEGLAYNEVLAMYVQRFKQDKEECKPSKDGNISSKEYFYLHEIKIYRDYQVGVRQADITNKPILLYFNGYDCVNSRKMEYNLFTNSKLAKYINDNLVLISLYVDDRSQLAKHERRFSEILGREIKTKGHLHQEMQVAKYNYTGQPFLVLLDLNKKETSRIGYTKSIDEFQSFLGMKKE